MQRAGQDAAHLVRGFAFSNPSTNRPTNPPTNPPTNRPLPTHPHLSALSVDDAKVSKRWYTRNSQVRPPRLFKLMSKRDFPAHASWRVPPNLFTRFPCGLSPSKSAFQFMSTHAYLRILDTVPHIQNYMDCRIAVKYLETFYTKPNQRGTQFMKLSN